jgi:hypothetical protein
VPAAPAGPPRAAPTTLFNETAEVRLSGATARQAVCDLLFELPPDAVVAVNHVRVYVTRTGDPDAPSSAIGEVEFRAELLGNALSYTTRSTDFRKGDLVVVRADIAIYGTGPS